MFNSTLSSSYLLTYDLIDRFSYNVLKDYPKLTRISMHFSLKQLKENAINRKDASIKIKGFLLLYLLFGLNPVLQYNNIKTFDIGSKKNDESFFIETLSFKHSDEINNFIHYLFVENNLKGIVKSFVKQKIKVTNSKLVLTLTFPMSVFSDISEFCSMDIIDISAKDLMVDVSFSFKHCIGSNESYTSMFMPFWHFG